MNVVVIACESGSLPWPSNMGLFPKQFLSVASENTMLQETLARTDGLASDITLIWYEEHRFIIAQQSQDSKHNLTSIILEQVGRNTAPAVALAAFEALESAIDETSAPLLLIMAADHVIEDVAAFHQAVGVAKAQAENGKIVTFGIVPESAHTGYGYIQRGSESGSGAYAVSRFVEKPDVR